MNRLQARVAQRGARRRVLDGRAWIVVWLFALLVVTGVAFASPAYAQTDDGHTDTELGEDLYPPTDYPTDESQGIVGIGRYDIGCANDGFVGDVGCLTVGTATNLIFSLGKLMVAVAIWLLEAATGFVIEAALTDAATTIADLLDSRVLGPMRLSHFGLVVSALHMGWQFLRGRVGAGAGEFALTLVVFAVLVHVSAGPGFGGAVTGAMQAAGGISAEIVSLAADTDRGGNVSDRVGGALVASFVRDPYDTISWGQLLDGTACEPARNQALASGPHGFEDTPRQLMTTAGCETHAAFNAEASVSRLIGSLLYLGRRVCGPRNVRDHRLHSGGRQGHGPVPHRTSTDCALRRVVPRRRAESPLALGRRPHPRPRPGDCDGCLLGPAGHRAQRAPRRGWRVVDPVPAGGLFHGRHVGRSTSTGRHVRPVG